MDKNGREKKASRPLHAQNQDKIIIIIIIIIIIKENSNWEEIHHHGPRRKNKHGRLFRRPLNILDVWIFG